MMAYKQHNMEKELELKIALYSIFMSIQQESVTGMTDLISQQSTYSKKYTDGMDYYFVVVTVETLTSGATTLQMRQLPAIIKPR